jgi:transcriptional regulator with XRE-family HTH domain
MWIDENFLYEYIGRRLKAQRKALKRTQANVAKATKLMRTSITNIESGKQKPPLHVLYLLCSELNLELRDIMPSNGHVIQETASVKKAGSGKIQMEVNGRKETVTPRTAETLRKYHNIKG